MRVSAQERVKETLQKRIGDGYEPTPTNLATLPPADPCNRRCPHCGGPLAIVVTIPKGQPPTAMPVKVTMTALIPREIGKKLNQREVETRQNRKP